MTRRPLDADAIVRRLAVKGVELEPADVEAIRERLERLRRRLETLALEVGMPLPPEDA